MLGILNSVFQISNTICTVLLRRNQAKPMARTKIIQTCPFCLPQPKQEQKILLRQYSYALKCFAQWTALCSLNGLSLKFSIFHGEQICQLNRNLLNILWQSHPPLNSCSFNPDVRAIDAYNQQLKALLSIKLFLMRKAFLLVATAPAVIILPRAVSLNTINGDIIFTLIFCRVYTTDLRKAYSFNKGYK